MKKIKGCYGENLAVCHFQREGYYVFKACQRNGPIDLITVDPDSFHINCYDVKAGSRRSDGSKIARSPRSKEGNIKIIYYDGRGGIIVPKKRKKKD
jgi:Holliday junction resolvase-like predicted endonuclease